ncbi:iron-containing redox enzyme family protein [Mesorhizobium sp. M0633]|uniref:iron-containing redox enzyme family protein n=1 Tax=Mesorhizobium sp. M0633 TaxID=2956977 RepID=UPI00333CAE5D
MTTPDSSTPEGRKLAAVNRDEKQNRKHVEYSDKLSAEDIRSNEPEYFHQLINIEDYQEFIPESKRLAERYLADGATKSLEGTVYAPLEYLSSYDEPDFDAAMRTIYDNLLESMYETDSFDTGTFWFPDETNTYRRYNVGKLSDACVRERLFQLAPFNLADGAWLQNIASIGPVNRVQSNLFSIWSDESGNGVTSQNHPNVYDALLKSQNIYLPPVTSREFIEQDFLPGAFTSPTFELAIGTFPQAFFPELLGMTLYLEWEATPTLTSWARMLAGRRMNPLFYSLHVAIDNISEGHGALAKESVKLYLEGIREEGGDQAVQDHWRRIRNGYITWLTIGDIGVRLVERYLAIEQKQINLSAVPEKKQCWPDLRSYCRQQMIRLVERKAVYARQIHRGKSIGAKPLAELFDDPETLLDSLVRYKYVNSERPRASKLLKLMEFDGPMYKVFTERDKRIILDWIDALKNTDYPCADPMPELPSPTELPDRMAKMIEDRSVEAMGAHDNIMITDTRGASVPLNSLFGSSPKLLQLLVANGWIVPGDPDRSIFLTRVIRNGGPMEHVFDDAEKDVIREWIAEGSHSVGEGSTKILSGGRAQRNRVSDSRGGESLKSPQRPLIGMGAVH